MRPRKEFPSDGIMVKKRGSSSIDTGERGDHLRYKQRFTGGKGGFHPKGKKIDAKEDP